MGCWYMTQHSHLSVLSWLPGYLVGLPSLLFRACFSPAQEVTSTDASSLFFLSVRVVLPHIHVRASHFLSGSSLLCYWTRGRCLGGMAGDPSSSHYQAELHVDVMWLWLLSAVCFCQCQSVRHCQTSLFRSNLRLARCLWRFHLVSFGLHLDSFALVPPSKSGTTFLCSYFPSFCCGACDKPLPRVS